MIRLILFLVAVAIIGLGAAWVADQGGNVVLNWSGWRIETSVPVFVLALVVTLIVALLVWSLVTVLLRAPARWRRWHHERRQARARHAITHGLLAIGTGDSVAARRHAAIARRDAHQDPLTLLLHAQAAQLDGDRAGARRAFQAMAQREDTRLLGLRGLFVEAQRADDAAAALAIAEEALKIAPASPWACHAVLGFRCASGDWDGALTLVAAQFTSGRIDRAQYHREKGVLLTARALESETADRDRAREFAYEAVKLAPTLVPAAVLAARFLSEAHQIRRAMRVIETAWLAQPHPDLADAYAHVRLGDSARQRLTRVETLAARTPGQIEGALAVARAAIDAGEFGRARAALAPFIGAPTQRVAMLMAEIERAENGDTGRARAWTLRAVRAALDPAWTADGYVSDRWRPVSPVSGRIDAFQWQTPVAALPSDAALHLDAVAADEAAPGRLAPPPPEILAPAAAPEAEPAPAAAPADPVPEPVEASPATGEPAAAAEPESTEQTPADTPAASAGAVPVTETAPPVFRPRGDIKPEARPAVPPIIPLVRPPDDPGVDEAGRNDGYDPLYPPQEQRGGWRGFLARWGA